MNCVLKGWVSEESPARQDSIWSSRIQELHTTLIRVRTQVIFPVGQHCSLTRRAETSTESTIFAQLKSLQCCTTRLIPIWFQYDIPTIRGPRGARYRTGSRRSCTSCVSNPTAAPNHMSHALRVHNSTCTTCEPPHHFSTTFSDNSHSLRHQTENNIKLCVTFTTFYIFLKALVLMSLEV